MIYVLYGSDTYRSRQKLKSIIAEFKKKSGGSTTLTTGSALSLEIFDAEETDPKKILSLSGTPSLFQEKKLIVIERLFSSKNKTFDFIKPKLKEWRDSKINVFVFWDEDVTDKKSTGLADALKYAEKSQEFEALTPQKTRFFIEKESAERKLRVAEKEKAALMNRYQNDLWGITNELDKMALGAELSEGTILNREEKIYNLVDALVEKSKTAPRLLFSLYEAGFDEFYIFAAIVNSFRNLLLVKKYSGDPKYLSVVEKELNLHPYVFKKLLSQSRRFDLKTLAAIYKKLLRDDLALKLGRTKLEYVVFDLM